MSSELDFCCLCNAWLGANEGAIRLSDSGRVEIVCDVCSKLNSTCTQEVNEVTNVEA